MLLFWRYGYEATSLSQLTTAMRITPPSLYTAFGDKQRLFLEAIERYTRGPHQHGGDHAGCGHGPRGGIEPFADGRRRIYRPRYATRMHGRRFSHELLAFQ